MSKHTKPQPRIEEEFYVLNGDIKYNITRKKIKKQMNRRFRRRPLDIPNISEDFYAEAH